MAKEDIYDGSYYEGIEKGAYGGYALEKVGSYFDSIASLLVKVVNPSKVLDVGCAKGFLVLSLTKLGVEAYGVDVSSYAIGTSPVEIRERLYQTDIEEDALPFPDDFFDLVCMHAVIEHLENLDKPLKEIRRVLAPKGFLYLVTVTSRFVPDSDITHVNIHPRSFWIDFMKQYGFFVDKALLRTLLGQLVRSRRELVKAQKSYQKFTLPRTRVGRILRYRLGRFGKAIRITVAAWLNYFTYFVSLTIGGTFLFSLSEAKADNILHVSKNPMTEAHNADM